MAEERRHAPDEPASADVDSGGGSAADSAAELPEGPGSGPAQGSGRGPQPPRAAAVTTSRTPRSSTCRSAPT